MNTYKKEFEELIQEDSPLSCLVDWLEENDKIILFAFRSNGSDTVHNCQRFLKEEVPYIMKRGVTYVRSPRMEELIKDDLEAPPVKFFSHDKGLYAIFGLRMEEKVHLLYIIA